MEYVCRSCIQERPLRLSTCREYRKDVGCGADGYRGFGCMQAVDISTVGVLGWLRINHPRHVPSCFMQ